MGTQEIQFLSISDNGPVYGSRFPKNAEFHESSQLADHFQALHHTGRMSGCFYIYVAAVAVGHVQYSLYHILPAGIDGYVGSEFLCLFQPVVGHVQGD